VIASEHGPRCIAPEAVAGEIARHVPRLAAKRKLDPALLFAALQVMPIEWKAATEYESHREEAERRIAERDPDDWPTIALALKLHLPIWTQDKDHTDARIELFTTGDLLDALRDSGPRPVPPQDT
jgi:predicted nucleic acid-binding protein